MMDEAFLPLNSIIDKILDIPGDFKDEENGVHSYIYEIEVGTPIELDISMNDDGTVRIGTVPPIYRVDTSFRPSYHSITIKAEKYTASEDGE